MEDEDEDEYDWSEEVNNLKIDSIDDARQIIKAWMKSAAYFSNNAEYYRKERNKYIEKYEPLDSIERRLLDND